MSKKEEATFSTFLKESFLTFAYTALIIATVLLNGVLIAYLINGLQKEFGYGLKPDTNLEYVE